MAAGKDVLIVYYSLTGNTERVAKDIAARLDADIERIEERSSRTGALGYLRAALDAWRSVPGRIGHIKRDPSQYALTIVGTPIWMGRMTPAIRAYLQSASGRPRRMAFFSTSGGTSMDALAPSLKALTKCPTVAVLGLNSREQNDRAAYEKKLSTFIGEVDVVRKRR